VCVGDVRDDNDDKDDEERSLSEPVARQRPVAPTEVVDVAVAAAATAKRWWWWWLWDDVVIQRFQ
jgi:hypothetical protein